MSQYAANTSHKFLQLPDRVLHTYNSWDSHNTGKLLPELMRELRDPASFSPGQWNWFETVVQPLQLAVLAMQKRGILVDRAARSKFTRDLSRELAETDNAIRREAAKRGFSYTDKFPNSDTQVAKLLFETCELRPTKTTDGGRASVDQDALIKVLRDLRKKDEHARDLLYNLCHRSRLQTMLERYTGFELGPDSRVRATVKMAGTKTWRFAYADPALQQFPVETRHYFRSTPGHLLIAGDFSQLEARWLAILADDQVSLAAFAKGEDIHAQNAMDLLGYRSAQWDTAEAHVRKASRNFAKSFLYRISYGGEGAQDKDKSFCPCPRCVDKVPQTLTLKRSDILAAETRWFDIHSAVRKFHRELIAEVQKRKYYETVFGVRRYFSKTWGPEFERELKNAPMQTSSALLMNRCQVQLHKLGAPILLQHHDSFMLEVPESPGRLVDQWTADLKGVMETPVPELGGVVFPTETKVGYDWASV